MNSQFYSTWLISWLIYRFKNKKKLLNTLVNQISHQMEFFIYRNSNLVTFWIIVDHCFTSIITGTDGVFSIWLVYISDSVFSTWLVYISDSMLSTWSILLTLYWITWLVYITYIVLSTWLESILLKSSIRRTSLQLKYSLFVDFISCL